MLWYKMTFPKSEAELNPCPYEVDIKGAHPNTVKGYLFRGEDIYTIYLRFGNEHFTLKPHYQKYKLEKISEPGKDVLDKCQPISH